MTCQFPEEYFSNFTGLIHPKSICIFLLRKYENLTPLVEVLTQETLQYHSLLTPDSVTSPIVAELFSIQTSQ